MASVVVMGAGIGGISQAYELRIKLGKNHDIVLIGDSGVAFVALPQVPPRNTNWVSRGK